MYRSFISSHAPDSLKKYISEAGYELGTVDGATMTPPSPVYSQILTHPDIHMCQTGLWENSCIFHGSSRDLGPVYPGNIIYNAVCTGKYFIHSLKYTSPALLDHVKSRFPGITMVDVRQGYTWCSCLPVDDSSFITYDRGIASALSSFDTDVLLIQPGHIMLPGFDYGFIGGCAGNIIADGQRQIVFSGDLSHHPDCKKITAFIKDRDIDIVFFKDTPLTDIGSILADHS